MKRPILFLAFLAILIANPSYGADTQWVQTQMNANIGYSLFASDSDVYAATYDGVLSTASDGMPWFSAAPLNRNVYNVTVSNNYILAATVDGVFRSSDNGKSWRLAEGSPIVSGSGGTIGPHLFAKNGSYVFLLSWAQGVFRSADNGGSWQQVFVGRAGEGYQDYGASATCIGTVGETIVIGRADSNPFPIYCSSDNGATWEGAKLSRIDGYEDQLLSFHYTGGKLYAGGFMGFYMSADSGKSWTTQYAGTVDSQGQYHGLGIFRDIVSYGSTLVAAVDFHGIQVSRDGGKTWTGFNEGLIPDWSFASLAVKPPYIWALTGFFGNAYRRPLGEVATGVSETSDAPSPVRLFQNRPNPFNPVTTISYSLSRAGMVSLRVHDILGRVVATLADGYQTPGLYKVTFNAENLSSGVYFSTLTAEGQSVTRKLLVVK